MSVTAPATETPSFVIAEDILVEASIETTFASLLVQLGRQNETPEGKPPRRPPETSVNGPGPPRRPAC